MLPAIRRSGVTHSRSLSPTDGAAIYSYLGFSLKKKCCLLIGASAISARFLHLSISDHKKTLILNRFQKGILWPAKQSTLKSFSPPCFMRLTVGLVLAIKLLALRSNHIVVVCVVVGPIHEWRLKTCQRCLFYWIEHFVRSCSKIRLDKRLKCRLDFLWFDKVIR